MSSVPHLSTDPLPLESIPKPLLRHVDPKAPPPLRDMGAKGLVPGITPDHLALVLYNLHFDPEQKFRETAHKTFAELPAEMKQVMAQSPLPEAVFDFCGRRWVNDEALVPTLLANAVFPDVTVAWMAAHAEERVVEIIADYQVRFLRAPLIIEQLYLNPATRQSIIDRVLEFAQREKVDLTPYPGLHSITAALESDAKAQLQQGGEGASDDEFAAALKASVKDADREDAEGRSVEEIEAELETNQRKSANLQASLAKMNIAQRIRMATLGSKEARAILIRDPNRLVHMAAIQSPKITLKDIYDYADNKNLSEAVINLIANRKEAVRDYQLLMRLTRNPKLHLKTALKFINYLRPSELKSLARSRNVSPQVAKAAKILMDKRASGQGGGGS